MTPTFADTIYQVAYFFLPAYLANMAPVVVVGRFERFAGPIDGGHTWRGVRIFGDHKTWRGVLAGVVVGMLTFAAQRAVYQLGLLHHLALIDYSALDPLLPGFLLGLGTGVGDAVKSFFKRRVGIPPGASWLGFDQLDFMVGAYLFVAVLVVPPLAAVLAILPAILLGSVLTTAIAYVLGLKGAWI
jgi:CDP-2,3-bis-(O-geranylgeranyl)-sn-glycerol synthase